MKYRCYMCARATNSSISSLDRVKKTKVGLRRHCVRLITSHPATSFSPTKKFPASCYFIAFFKTHIQVKNITWFQQFRPSNTPFHTANPLIFSSYSICNEEVPLRQFQCFNVERIPNWIFPSSL